MDKKRREKNMLKKLYGTFFICTVSLVLMLSACGSSDSSAKKQETLNAETGDWVKNISDEYQSVYIDELYLLSRYAFETTEEYNDIDGGFTEEKHRVYSGDSAMDDNELFAEYYLVTFLDKNGDRYLASLSVYPEKYEKQDLSAYDVSEEIMQEPVKITAAVAVALDGEASSFTNDYELERYALRDAKIEEAIAVYGGSYSGINMVYHGENPEE